jgi:hypothetical protein
LPGTQCRGLAEIDGAASRFVMWEQLQPRAARTLAGVAGAAHCAA